MRRSTVAAWCVGGVVFFALGVLLNGWSIRFSAAATIFWVSMCVALDYFWTTDNSGTDSSNNSDGTTKN